MAVYVDTPRRSVSKGGDRCLMAAWPRTEATRILLEKIVKECEAKPCHKYPHVYKITRDQRSLAIKLGAVPISIQSFELKFRFKELKIRVNP